jgi:hypothetical protein
MVSCVRRGGGLNQLLLDDDLLADIRTGNVIPIIGEDLLQVPYQGRDVPLYSYVAAKLAEQLRIPPETLPTPPTLNAVVSEYLRQNQRWDDQKPLPEDVYLRIPEILNNATFQLPQPLIDLASIDKFTVFISLTFDSMLVNAINEKRFSGERRTLELKYSETPDDLPSSLHSGTPIVYQLFGKASPAAYSYVVSDEDMLEFVRLLQRPLPLRLFSALKDSRLLFIGCGFSDWLARFLLRIAYERRMWEGGRRGRDRVVGGAVDSASSFAMFLRTFSPRTMVMPHPPGDFVAALAMLYRERFGHVAEQRVTNPPSGAADGQAEEGMIFLSYAREDADAARRLHNFLLANNVRTWFDEEKNKGGDNWALNEVQNINSCSYFVPIMSMISVGRMEGEYRREWKLAIDRLPKRDESVPFIIPIAIDDTTAEADGVPREFKASHWERLPGGNGTPAFAAMMKERMRAYARRMAHG